MHLKDPENWPLILKRGREDVEGISERCLDVVPKMTHRASVTKAAKPYGNKWNSWIVPVPYRVAVSSVLISLQNYS